MKIRGPERFYSVQFNDEHGFYPVDDLLENEDWSTAHCLEFVMGDRPSSFTVLTGYGISIEHEDFWVYGRTEDEVLSVAEEWPQAEVS